MIPPSDTRHAMSADAAGVPEVLTAQPVGRSGA